MAVLIVTLILLVAAITVWQVTTFVISTLLG
jgi:hypothetical protein